MATKSYPWKATAVSPQGDDGDDACSEVTNIILDVMQEIKTVAPPLSFRWHDKLQKKTIDKVVETLASGLSEPAILNDKMMFQRLMSYGVPMKEARDYSINTCMWWVIPGKNICFRASNVYEPDYRDVMLIGINNVANSLAALKKNIFDDTKAILLELIDALKNNWKGSEALLKDCLDAPKFGNDDDYVDLICRHVLIQLTEEVSTHKERGRNNLVF